MEVYNWKKELEKDTIASLFDITVCSKTLIMFTGQSRAGKTVTCLNLMNSAILNKKKVVYFDLDEKSIIKRPEPNFFNKFYSEHKQIYETYFNCIREFDIKSMYELLNKIKPQLVIIDNIYSPFEKLTESGMKRAKMIKKFLSELRDYIWSKNMGCVLTTPTKRMAIKGKIKQVSLGGESITFLSDVKISIDFPQVSNDEDSIEKWRKFIVDKNLEYEFKINKDGKIIAK